MPVDRNRYVRFILAPDLSNTRQSVTPQPDKKGFYLLTEKGQALRTENGTGLEPEGDDDG